MNDAAPFILSAFRRSGTRNSRLNTKRFPSFSCMRTFVSSGIYFGDSDHHNCHYNHISLADRESLGNTLILMLLPCDLECNISSGYSAHL